jgi:hypothetical protein
MEGIKVMKYYKNNAGDIFGFDNRISKIDELTELTAQELELLFNPPESALTTDEQIAALEASITPRNLRGAALGDQFAIDKIQAVEDEIKALRE